MKEIKKFCIKNYKLVHLPLSSRSVSLNYIYKIPFRNWSIVFQYVKNKSVQLRGERTIQKVTSYSLWLIGLSGNAVAVVSGSLLAYFLAKQGLQPFILTGRWYYVMLVAGVHLGCLIWKMNIDRWDGCHVFQIFLGKVSGGLPPFQIPAFSTGNATFVDMVRNMGSAILATPLISIMETMAIAKAFGKDWFVKSSRHVVCAV